MINVETIDRADLAALKERQLAIDIVDAMMGGINLPEMENLPLPQLVARKLLAKGWDKAPLDETSDWPSLREKFND